MLEKEMLSELKEINRQLKSWDRKFNTIEFFLKKISDRFEEKAKP